MQTQTGMEATELDKMEGCLSSGAKYRHEWISLLASLDTSLDQLRNSAFNGDLKVSKFRSICWSILLRVLSSNPSDWFEQRKQQRERYQKLKKEFAKNPHNINSMNDNPLSQSKQSVWNQYFGDQELFSVIKQDVIRTFPGVDFFRKECVQETMTNILFYYAREHPYMSYRQGMHEILAPILFVMFYDHQSFLHFKELSENIDNILANVLNPIYLEEDCYSLFSRLMSSIESYYRITNMVPTAEGYFPSANLNSNDEFQHTSEIEVIGQLNFIRDKILAKEDQHLHIHLQKLEIPLHIFGIRWLRLLFGREFPLLDLLMLWDAIFAESDNFQLPNYILVSMLIRIRDKLIVSDYTSCLTYLMKYPNNVDIGLILRYALYMQYPNKFELPHNVFPFVNVQKENVKVNSKPNSYRQLQTNTLPKKQHKPIRTNSDSVQKESNSLQRARSFSLTMKSNQGNVFKIKNNEPSRSVQTNYNIQSTIEELQYANVLNLVHIDKLKASQNNAENVILDGLSEHSAEYLQIQLQNAQTVIAVSRFKLGKYLETLRKYSSNSPDDLCQVIDGIGELCAFLDVKFSLPSNIPLPVDAAFEANENQLNKNSLDISANSPISNCSTLTSPLVCDDFTNSSKEDSTSAGINKQSNSNITEAKVKSEFFKILENNKRYPYETMVDEKGNKIDFKTISVKKDDDYSAKPTFLGSTVRNSTRYEIPDTGFMQNCYNILGTRKDVELTLFKEERGSQNENNLPNIDPLNLKTDLR